MPQILINITVVPVPKPKTNTSYVLLVIDKIRGTSINTVTH